MTRTEFNRFFQKAIASVSKYVDKEGQPTSVKVERVCRRKAIEVVFWHGTSPEIRKKLLEGRFDGYFLCGYPVVFDNHRGGGNVQSYTIMWLDNIK